MTRSWRAYALAALCALAVAFGARPARADGPVSAGGLAARDLVEVDPTGAPLRFPPLPASYVVVHRGPVTVAYPPAIEPQVRATVARVERDVSSLAAQLGLVEVPPLEVRLVPDPDVMRDLAPVDAPPPAYAVGVAYPGSRVALVSASAPQSWEAADMVRVLRHELSHLLLAEATRPAAIPRWFSEGVAVDQAAEHSFDRFKALAVASFTRGIVPIRRLDASFSAAPEQVNVAYAESADFVGYLLRADGAGRFRLLLQHLREGDTFEAALRSTYGKSLANLEVEWRHDLDVRFLTAPLWASTGLLWIVAIALLLVAMVRRRRRSRATLSRWAREESALAALSVMVATPGASLDAPQPAALEAEAPDEAPGPPSLPPSSSQPDDRAPGTHEPPDDVPAVNAQGSNSLN